VHGHSIIYFSLHVALPWRPFGVVQSLGPWHCVVPFPQHRPCSSAPAALTRPFNTPVFNDAIHACTYCKLQECINKNYMHQSLVWNVLDEEFGDNNQELNTMHSYIAGKPNAPAVHFEFWRLMPFLCFKSIVTTFKGTKYNHKSLVTGWASFSKCQYECTFQRRHSTCKQTVQEGCILESAQFCFGYREEEREFDTYWAQVVRLNWVRNNVSTPRKPSEFDWTVTLVLNYCSTIAFFQDDAPNPSAALRQCPQPIVSTHNFDQQDYAL
jgi:hypothetical protein